ncbi:MAG: hypothetical protein EPN84_05725 [Legionella sp.]|nr:MAG: hypothetical protein EPN84_05725 [Legionella sp.]
MTQIISTPNAENSDAFGFNSHYQFGYYEAVNHGHRNAQQDALTWMSLSEADLTPKFPVGHLNAQDIGYRLWTAYRLLDSSSLKGGTTASTTVYDGKGSLITATIADAASFAVAYDEIGKPLEVIRLNRRVHTTQNNDEIARICENEGSFISRNRVNGALNITRSIGDLSLKHYGVCSEADIDIFDLHAWKKQLASQGLAVSTFQVINVCDGFTDPADALATTEIKQKATMPQEEQDKLRKVKQEKYLLDILNTLKNPGILREDQLAKILVDQALKDESKDNVSAAVHTLKLGRRMLMGVYDGHGFDDAACYVAENIGSIFKAQCKLIAAEYRKQVYSIYNNLVSYERDNPQSFKGTAQSSTSTVSSPKPIQRTDAMTRASVQALPGQSIFPIDNDDDMKSKKAKYEETPVKPILNFIPDDDDDDSVKLIIADALSRKAKA